MTLKVALSHSFVTFVVKLFCFPYVSCAMMFMQSNAPPSCPVIRPLTPEDWKTYEKQWVIQQS